MSYRSILPAIALAALAFAPQVRTAVADDAHHPDTATPSQAQTAPTPSPSSGATGTAPMIGQGMGSGGIIVQPGSQSKAGQPGMMMGGMMGRQDGQADMMGAMGPMMRSMMMGQQGGIGMPFEHVEGRIAFLRAELGITEAQTQPWNAFADAMRASAKTHQGMVEQMMKSGPPAAWPDRLALQQKALATRLDALKALEAAAKPLYTVLTLEQKARADQLLAGPMGMM